LSGHTHLCGVNQSTDLLGQRLEGRGEGLTTYWPDRGEILCCNHPKVKKRFVSFFDFLAVSGSGSV
jgi:hypothetical protein